VLSWLLLALWAGSAFADDMKIIVAVNGKNLYATLEDNPASRALYAQMPFTVKMQDLYKREMCFHMSAKLPESKQVATNYKVGDIIYWPPRMSLVILYKQNGERFRRQHLGHIDSGVEIFQTTGDTEVTFAPAE
jgi:hypothetical protein